MLGVVSLLQQNLVKKSIFKEFEGDGIMGESEFARRRPSEECT